MTVVRATMCLMESMLSKTKSVKAREHGALRCNATPLRSQFNLLTMAQQCVFHKCVNPVVPGFDKCNTHRHRRQCIADDCGNQAYARGYCVRHGGMKKCAHLDCHVNAFVGAFCARHDSLRQACCVQGCTNPVPVTHSKSSRQDFPPWRLCLEHHNIAVAELEGMLAYPEFLEYIDEVLDGMTDVDQLMHSMAVPSVVALQI
ncbi:hypothetical protein AC1031_020445 [Aphanomyces cochlioides]|nr:hypothetical protein AC1031_020445 [Aphanomyces cochlioides]